MRFIGNKGLGLIGLDLRIKILIFSIDSPLKKWMNRVKSLEYEDGFRTDSSTIMEEVAKQYFENLFSSHSGGGNLNSLLKGVEECISVADNKFLSVVYTKEEVVRALKEMRLLKTPNVMIFRLSFFRSIGILLVRKSLDFILTFLIVKESLCLE